jgi:riboflavin kinase, archaea type
MIAFESVLVALAGQVGSSGGSAEVSTAELGRLLGVSQQTASRYLKGLEERGLIRRVRSSRCFTVKLTPEGITVLRGIHANIGRFLDSELKQSFEGVIASGIGEGAYYVGEYADRIMEAVGYRPYPGTLNVRFRGEKPNMNTDRTVDIEEFTSGGRTFGRVGLTPVKLHVMGRTIECHVIIPERTHHRRDIELIAKDNLRRKHRLEDGADAVITFS